MWSTMGLIDVLQMTYPGYLLNPGDLFQVDPSAVMYALGKPKVREVEEEAEEEDETDTAAASTEEADDSDAAAASEEDRTPKEILKSLLAQSKSILADSKSTMSGKRKQELREFSKGVKKLMSKAGRQDVDTSSMTEQFSTIEEQLQLALDTKQAAAKGQQPPPTSQPDEATSSSPTSSSEFLPTDAESLRLALQQVHIDDSKPYATPWTPRDFLSAFAFIPRYLEVNQNICAAVYLRHPVARPGLSEVPSPFPEAASANAFAWYLRRR
jgi:ribosomal protein S4